MTSAHTKTPCIVHFGKKPSYPYGIFQLIFSFVSLNILSQTKMIELEALTVKTLKVCMHTLIPEVRLLLGPIVYLERVIKGFRL